MSSITVCKIDVQADHSQAIAELQKWRVYAAEREKVAHTLPDRSFIKVLEDMGTIHALATTMIRILKYKQTWYDCYFASQEGCLQGVSILQNHKKGYREIHALFTRPHNLSSEVEHKAEKIRGVGKVLVTHAIHEMLAKNDERDLLVQSARQSIGFYAKCHFREITHNTADFYYRISKAQRILAYDPAATLLGCAKNGALPLPAALGVRIIDFLLPPKNDKLSCFKTMSALVEVLYQDEQDRAVALAVRQRADGNDLSENLAVLSLEDNA